MLWQSQTWHKTTVGSQCSGLCSLCCHWRTNSVWKLHIIDGRKELWFSVHMGHDKTKSSGQHGTPPRFFGIPTWWSISEFTMCSEKSDLRAPSIWPASSIYNNNKIKCLSGLNVPTGQSVSFQLSIQLFCTMLVPLEKTFSGSSEGWEIGEDR